MSCRQEKHEGHTNRERIRACSPIGWPGRQVTAALAAGGWIGRHVVWLLALWTSQPQPVQVIGPPDACPNGRRQPACAKILLSFCVVLVKGAMQCVFVLPSRAGEPVIAGESRDDPDEAGFVEKVGNDRSGMFANAVPLCLVATLDPSQRDNSRRRGISR